MAKQLDEKKIAFIVYVQDEDDYKACAESLRELSCPAGYSIELLPTNKAATRGMAYQAGMNASDAKYKVYIDSSAWIVYEHLLSETLDIFSRHPEIGILGLSGTEIIPPNAPFWVSPARLGKWSDKNGEPHEFGAFDEPFREVQALDMYFLMTQYDVPWRTDLFNDDLFLCASQSIEFQRQGYKACVVHQDATWLAYAKIDVNASLSANEHFLDEYSKDLFPLVSVVIPTWCRPEYFKIALDSVLAQTYRNLDIFITDNSPDDRTEELMRSYLKKYPWIQYEHHKGYNAKENWLVARRYNNPKAEYVNWLMDDDVFMPEKIAEMISCYLFNPGVTLVTSYRQLIDADGNLLPDKDNTAPIADQTKRFPGRYLGNQTLAQLGNYIGEPTTALIPKKLMKNGDLGWTGNEGRYLLSDVPTWLNLMEQGDVIYIRKPLSQFRQHPGQQQKSFGTIFRVMINWAINIRYAWERKVFLETEWDLRTAIFNWTRTAAQNISAYQEDKPDLSPDDESDLRVLEQVMAGMTAAVSNEYVFDFCEELDADEMHIAARKKISRKCACCDHFVAAYLPLPSGYEAMAKKFNAPKRQAEMLNKEEYTCPTCYASDRERAYAIWMKRHLDAAQPNLHILDIAPSAATRSFIKKNFPLADYKCGDLFMPDVDYKLDIMDMHQIETESIDFFLCSHVLEHVRDDKQAMKELWRILRYGGRGICVVPMDLLQKEIDEDPDCTDVGERWRRFGQDDHSKQGYLARLQEAGFFVKEYNAKDFGSKAMQENGLSGTATVYVVYKT
ncbi:MAG: glycosyltransferase [Schwartzia sp.]|nr:glycosyltransferase [Schwartzia sp. (in: firmicutes)]